MDIKNSKIGIIGMGYVGAPLAVEFGKKRKVVGFDLNLDRIKDLSTGVDTTLELSSSEINEAKNLKFTQHIYDLKDCSIYIVTVPTPVSDDNKPDLSPLQKATEMVGELLNENDIVIYESTVYPGATEEFCVPILEEKSGLKYNLSFFCGYSPERVNPGDPDNRLINITKVTSGSTPKIAKLIDSLYKEIIIAGTYIASSIKVAEAAKVIENTQRDVNIALINEFAVIFNKLEIDTKSVLKAAGTKWNFLSFSPGLVGGHCIGVDPYYLAHKSLDVGYKPEMILAGRKINDNMGFYIADTVFKKMKVKKIKIEDSNILIMGLTFKENCPDIRNTRVVDLIEQFVSFGCSVDIFDPWVNAADAKDEYGVKLNSYPKTGVYDAIVIAVAHEEFKSKGLSEIKAFGKDNCVIYDVKGLFEADLTDGRL